jgi:hypothetical protein
MDRERVGEDRGSKEKDGCPLTTGPCDTTAPSTVTRTPTYGRLGTGRLGTVILSISFVV